MQPNDPSKLSGVPAQEFNEQTGKYQPLDIQKRQAQFLRRKAIIERQLMSEWQCTKCKRKCKGDGSESSDGRKLPLVTHREIVTEAHSDLAHRINLERVPVDFLERLPELWYCGFCGGPVIMTQDAGKLK